MEIDEKVMNNDFTIKYTLDEMILSFNDCNIALEEIYKIIEETNKKEPINVKVNQPQIIYWEKYNKILFINEFTTLFFSFSIEQITGYFPIFFTFTEIIIFSLSFFKYFLSIINSV